MHLKKVLKDGEVDPLFLQDFRNLIDAELKLNKALHGTLKAHALMRRLLVTEEKDMLNYLPDDHEVRRAQRLFLAQHPGYSRHGSRMDHVIHHIHRAKDLSAFLHGDFTNRDKAKDRHSADLVKELVEDNMPTLLHRRWFFHDKHKTYYRILNNYVEKNHIHLSQSEEYKLKKRAGLPVEDLEFEGDNQYCGCFQSRSNNTIGEL